MKLDIHERDIGSELCQRCAACCRITFNLQDTTPRYRRFLRQIGYTLIPPPAQGQADCCNKKHDVKADHPSERSASERCEQLRHRRRGRGRYGDGKQRDEQRERIQTIRAIRAGCEETDEAKEAVNLRASGVSPRLC